MVAVKRIKEVMMLLTILPSVAVPDEAIDMRSSLTAEPFLLIWEYHGKLERETSDGSALVKHLEKVRPEPLNEQERQFIASTFKGKELLEVQGRLEVHHFNETTTIRLRTQVPAMDLRNLTNLQKDVDFLLIFHPSYTMRIERFEEEQTRVQVWKPPKGAIGYYSPIPFGIPSTYPFLRVDFEILSGLSLDKVPARPNVVWQKSEGGWTTSVDLPLKRRLKLRRDSDNRVLQVQLLREDEQLLDERRYQVTHQVNGIPDEFQVEITRERPLMRGTVHFKLVRKARQVEPPNLETNLLVEDYRLASYEDVLSGNTSAVNYRWTGHLPSEEELQQLAYQQGNLVPPETPRRRYSLWLFVPAALFFLAAAYLYFKNRRS